MTQPIRQELLIDGVWEDVTSGDHGTKGGTSHDVTITRGESSEQSGGVAADTASFALKNPDGRYSDSNPLSPLYGLLDPGVQYRCSIVENTKSLRLTDATTVGTTTYDGARAWTADKAALDLTGDIDVRVDVEPDDWRGRMGHILAGKYQVIGDQRSWAFFTDQRGYPYLIWSTNGTSAARQIIRATEKAATSGRQALRATLDVNNGSGGYTVTFYTADTISGSWTQLGSPVVGSSTTSIHSGTAPLEVGNVNDAVTGRGIFTTNLNSDPFVGRFYGLEVRSGIGGSVVARMDATAQAVGATSWSDGLGNTWSLTASAEISDADYRFWGEVPEFPSDWDVTGSDVTAPVIAYDIVERLRAGEKPLRSPIFRNLSRYATDGYWPMEDDFGATSIGAHIGKTGYFKSASFSSADGLPGAGGALAFTDDDGYASANAVVGSANTGTAYVLFYFYLEAAPASEVAIFDAYFVGGDAYRAEFSVGPTNYKMELINSSGTVLATSNTTFGTDAGPGQWIAMRLLLRQNGGSVDTFLSWYPVGASVYWGTTTSYVGTCGRPRSWISWPFVGKGDLRLTHVALASIDLGFDGFAFTQSTNGYIGENAWDRAFRLAAELGIPFWWVGPRIINAEDMTAAMGVQGLRAPVDLFQEIADVDGGMLCTPRDKFGLMIRSSYSLQGREPLELDYTDTVFSGKLTPRRPRDISNDVTVTRPEGSFGRAVKTTGRYGTVRAGVRDTSIPLNAGDDGHLVGLAEREVDRRTVEALRFTGVQLDLHRAPFVQAPSLARAVERMDVGSAFSIVNLPLFGGGPDPADLYVRGYTETITNFTRTIQPATAPYAPHRTGVWGSSSQPTSSRWAAKNVVLMAERSSAATTLIFGTSDGRERWSTTAVPYDVMILGERITVSSITSGGTAGSLAIVAGDMESGTTTGWSFTGGSGSSTTAQAQSGTRSLLLTVAGSPTQAYVRTSGTTYSPLVNPGFSYRPSGWIRSSAALSSGGVSIDWYDADVNYLSTSFAGSAVAANTWTSFSTTVTAPANARYAAYGLTAAGSPPNGTLAYFDNIDFQVTATGLQTATVIRGVNGSSKTGTAGAPVQVREAGRWAWRGEQ